MANYTINKRMRKSGTVYCARVRSQEYGTVTFSKSKTFNSKVAAIKWAKYIIHKVEGNINNQNIELLGCTLKKLITQYINKKQNSTNPLGRTSYYSLKNICTCPIAELQISKLTSHDIVEFCLFRKKSKHNPPPQTIAIDVSNLRKVLKISKSMFNIHVNDQVIREAYPALYDLNLIGRSNKRERRLTENELKLIIPALKHKERHHCCLIPYCDIFIISIITCCRIGEVCNLMWDDLNIENKTIIVRNRKNPNGSLGNNSVLPLLGNAINILLNQPKTADKIFPFNSKSITSGFRKTLKSLNINDFKYHDLRREGASRLIEKRRKLKNYKKR